MSFSFVTCPSTIPLLIHQVKPALTASLSFSIPASLGLEFGKLAAFYFVQPGIEVLSGASAQQLGKLLYQVIGQVDFRADLTDLAKLLQLLDIQFWRRDEERGRQLAVKLGEQMSSTRPLQHSCVLRGADEQGYHVHSHRTPCSLAPPVRESGRQYYGTRLPNARAGREDTDQGGWPAHAVYARGRFQKLTSC